jgi:ribosomal protein S18 acetylase RimI-like enzyme
MDIRITEATENDIALIKDMAEIVFKKTYEPILTVNQIEYMMELMYSEKNLVKQFKEGHRFFIAYIKERACGYVSVQKEKISGCDTEFYHLHKLYVMPDVHGNGVGKLLFDKACTYAKNNSDNRKVRIELNVNRKNPSIDFYKKMGMYVAREGDFPIGNGYLMNDYIMSIDI